MSLWWWCGLAGRRDRCRSRVCGNDRGGRRRSGMSLWRWCGLAGRRDRCRSRVGRNRRLAGWHNRCAAWRRRVSLAALRRNGIYCCRRRRRGRNLGALRAGCGGVGVASSGLGRSRQVNGRGDRHVLGGRLRAGSRRRGLGRRNRNVSSRARCWNRVRGALRRDWIVHRRTWRDWVASSRLGRWGRVVSRRLDRGSVVRAALGAGSAARLGRRVRVVTAAAGLGVLARL
jgi:hypothetical protein